MYGLVDENRLIVERFQAYTFGQGLFDPFYALFDAINYLSTVFTLKHHYYACHDFAVAILGCSTLSQGIAETDPGNVTYIDWYSGLRFDNDVFDVSNVANTAYAAHCVLLSVVINYAGPEIIVVPFERLEDFLQGQSILLKLHGKEGYNVLLSGSAERINLSNSRNGAQLV